ncbi:UMP kinase [Candidatus Woesearchaeota archaeon]|nr:UMP kinase [Candidatus Woesearchaeota archaeon]
MDVVISLGGSMVVPEKVNVDFLRKFADLVKNYAKKSRVVIICGGGATARTYQNAARELSCATEDLDWIGTRATILNAELVRSLFGKSAYEKVVTNPTEKIKTKKHIIVGSGWKPGFSSDMDAVLIAENLKIKTLINLTNIDYVYDKDPKKFSNANPFKKMSWQQLQKLVGTSWTPGANVPFDPVATKRATKAKLTLYIIKGEIENLKNILEKKVWKGTIIV